MLCYRCGSYTPDDSRKCTVCGQPIAPRRRMSRSLSGATTGRSRAVPPLETGDLLAGRYRITGTAGTGTTGWVMRARDEEVDVDVAVKLVAANLLQTEADCACFIKAVKAARRLQHPNLVRIYDEGRGEIHLFYTMPFLEGLSLRRIIDLRHEKGHTFSLSEALPLFGQFALAIDALTKQNGHGAIRPANVIVLPDMLKLTGVPHLRGLPRPPFLALQSRAGSLEYLAPEARREDGEVDTRSDVYSMTVIFAEMITGQIYGRDPHAWAAAESRLPRKIIAALHSGFAESPSARPATAAALFEALAEGTAEVHSAAPERLPDDFGDTEPTPAAPGRSAELVAEMLAGVERGSEPEVDLEVEVEAEPELGRETREPPSGPRAAGSHGGPQPSGHDASSLAAASRWETPRRSLLRPVDPPRERRGRGGRRSGLLGLLVATILLSGLAISAAMWWRSRPRGPELRPVREPAEQSAVVTETGAEPVEPGDQPRRKAKDRDRNQNRDRDKARRPRDRDRREPESAAVPDRAAWDRDAGSGHAPDLRPGEVRSPMEPPPPPAPVIARPAEAVMARPSETVTEPPPPPPPPPSPALAAAEVAPVSAAAGCPAGMIRIEAGGFEMGSRPSDPMRGFGELPAGRRQTGAFCIDVFEYPNERGKMPAVSYTWSRAKRACEKLGKRLCAEEEWERACKGPGNSGFPFGDRFDARACNVSDGAGEGRPAGAGQHPRCKSGYGVMDMAGNVGEWTASQWAPDVSDKVIKGGAADHASYMARCAARANDAPSGKQGNVGFRCCSDVE